MKKIFSVILVLGFIFASISYSQNVEKIQIFDENGKKIIKIPGAFEDFVGEGFRNLDKKQKEVLDYFQNMVSAEFSEIVHSEIKNVGMIKEVYWGIRGMSSKKLAILFHSFKVGTVTDMKNYTGKVIKSELVFVYYFDDLQSAPKTGEGSLFQIAESIAQKFVNDIKEKIEKTK